MWLLFCKVCTCTSWCSSLLVDMPVPSYSLVSPSLHVQLGTTPLLMAAQEGHAEVARFLLGNGSSVTEQDNVGWPKGILTSCDHLMLFPGACTPVIVPQTQWEVWPSSVVKLPWPPLRCFIVACTAIGLYKQCTQSVGGSFTNELPCTGYILHHCTWSNSAEVHVCISVTDESVAVSV